MILLIAHIILSFTSLGLMLGALAGRLIKPQSDYTRLTQGSAATFVGLVGTGAVLVVKSGSPILGACLQGLCYLGGLSVAYVVYRKLATTQD